MCLCAQRRQNIVGMARGIRAGDRQMVRENVQQFNQSIKTDVNALKARLAALRPKR